ncbi:MAG: NINE protein [Acutalibacteraceae bacterium]
MYCRNCGNEMAENAAVCINCGVSKGNASNFCPNCGSQTNPEAAICVKCGVALKKGTSGSSGNSGEKTKMVAGLLAIFLGHLGLHEFYLGNKKKAMYKIIATVVSSLLMFVGIGFIGFIAVWGWNIYDAVMIFTGKRQDADGNELA